MSQSPVRKEAIQHAQKLLGGAKGYTISDFESLVEAITIGINAGGKDVVEGRRVVELAVKIGEVR